MNFFIIIIIGKSIGDGVAFFSANMRGQQIFGLLASLLFRWEDRYGCPRRQEWHGMREDLLGGACIELGFFLENATMCVLPPVRLSASRFCSKRGGENRVLTQ